MDSKPVLFAVDQAWAAERAWGVMRPTFIRNDSQEINFALSNLRASMQRITRDLESVAFDEGLDTRLVASVESGGNWRKRDYPEYKANRPKRDEKHLEYLARSRGVFVDLGFELYCAPGCEGDDALATMATLSASQGWDVRVFSSDADLLQVVRDDVVVLAPWGRSADRKTRKPGYQRFDTAAVLERYGFGPTRLPLYKAISGDKSDNIPGALGLGPQAGRRLAADYKNVKEMFEHLEVIGSTDRAKLNAAGQERLALFERLCTLRCDANLADVHPTQPIARRAPRLPDLALAGAAD